ncbi:hypothetical protein Bbelb_124910 [Branchiostoma belcheri]|nr:hypothetical protein Bbelb_124910 [Branchiostoma belcheri]
MLVIRPNTRLLVALAASSCCTLYLLHLIYLENKVDRNVDEKPGLRDVSIWDLFLPSNNGGDDWENGRQEDPVRKLLQIARVAGYPEMSVDRAAEKVSEIRKVVEEFHRAGAGDKDPVEKPPPKPKLSKERMDQIAKAVANLRKADEKLPFERRAKLWKMGYERNDKYSFSDCDDMDNSVSRNLPESAWFSERYMDDLKLFLDTEDIDNPYIYHKLRHYGLPFGFGAQKRDVMARLVHNDNFTNDDIHGDYRKTCLSCAVVGSSGDLKGAGMGREIDKHDYVFRLNKAMTGSLYWPDIGNKTTFYTFYPESNHVHLLNNKEDVVYLFAPFKQYDVDYVIAVVEGEPMPKIKANNKYWSVRNPKIHGRQLKLFHPDFLRYIHVSYLNHTAGRPTTGAMLVFTAVHMCDKVDIYGFGYDPRFSAHYYDTSFHEHTDKGTVHNSTNERRVWERLHADGIINWWRRDR